MARQNPQWQPSGLERQQQSKQDKQMIFRKKKEVKKKTPIRNEFRTGTVTEVTETGVWDIEAMKKLMKDIKPGGIIQMPRGRVERFEFDPGFEFPRRYEAGFDMGMGAERVVRRIALEDGDTRTMETYTRRGQTGMQHSLDNRYWFQEGEEYPDDYVRHALTKQGWNQRHIEMLLDEKKRYNPSKGRNPARTGAESWADQWATKQKKEQKNGKTTRSDVKRGTVIRKSPSSGAGEPAVSFSYS